MPAGEGVGGELTLGQLIVTKGSYHRFNASAFTNNSAGADSKYRNNAGHNQPSLGG